jgi:hypothetical protein
VLRAPFHTHISAAMNPVREVQTIYLTRLVRQMAPPGLAFGVLLVLSALMLFVGLSAAWSGDETGLSAALMGLGVGLVAFLIAFEHARWAFAVLTIITICTLVSAGSEWTTVLVLVPLLWIPAALVALRKQEELASAHSPEATLLQELVAQKLNTPDNQRARYNWQLARHNALRHTGQQAGLQVLRAGTWVLGGLLTPVAGPGLMFGALGALRAHAKEKVMRYGAVTATELLDTDRRAPVLYLRSFEDESLRALPSGDMEDRLEIILTETLSLVGPVVAVGDPADDLPPVGAARDYFGEQWQQSVRQFMERARIIVAIVNTTPGVVWEVETIRRAGLLHRVVFVVPPLLGLERQVRWAEFAQHVASSMAMPAVLDVALPTALAMFVDSNDRLVVLASHERNAAAYRLAIQMAAACKLA